MDRKKIGIGIGAILVVVAILVIIGLDAGDIAAIVAVILSGIALAYAHQSAEASKASAVAAEKAVDHQIAVDRKLNAADLTFIPNPQLGRHVSHSASGGHLFLHFLVLNRGLAPAYHIKLSTSIADQQWESQPHTILEPRKELEISLPLARGRIPMEMSANPRIVLTYQDGNGPNTRIATFTIKGPLDELSFKGFREVVEVLEPRS